MQSQPSIYTEVLILLGELLVLEGLTDVIVDALFVAVITRSQILLEERGLLVRFSNSFLLYK